MVEKVEFESVNLKNHAQLDISFKTAIVEVKCFRTPQKFFPMTLWTILKSDLSA